MDVPDNFTKIPCDLLLVLARKLDPEDYLGLSSTSKGIRNCLKTGRYTPEQEAAAIDFIKEQKEKLIKMVKDVSEDPENIKKYPNAPERVQLLAVKQDACAIIHIKRPSKKVQLASLYNTGDWICGEISDYDDDVIEEVARNEPYLFSQLDGGYDFDTALMIVKANPEVYEYIKRHKLDDLDAEEIEILELEVAKHKL